MGVTARMDAVLRPPSHVFFTLIVAAEEPKRLRQKQTRFQVESTVYCSYPFSGSKFETGRAFKPGSSSKFETGRAFKPGSSSHLRPPPNQHVDVESRFAHPALGPRVVRAGRRSKALEKVVRFQVESNVTYAVSGVKVLKAGCFQKQGSKK